MRWGDLESEDEESEEEEEEEVSAAFHMHSSLPFSRWLVSMHPLEDPLASTKRTPRHCLQEDEEEDLEDTESLADGLASVASGFASSLPSGIETPAEIDLRKTSEGPKQLYTVLEQQKATVGAGALMGSDHTYVIPGAQQPGKEKLSIAAQARRVWYMSPFLSTRGSRALSRISCILPYFTSQMALLQKRLEALRREMPSDVDVSIDPSELEGLDDAALRDLYEARVVEQRAAAGREVRYPRVSR